MKISKEWTGERAWREERAKSGVREIKGESIIFFVVKSGVREIVGPLT